MSVLWIKDSYKQGSSSSQTIVVTPDRLEEGNFKTVSYEKHLPKKLSTDTLLLVKETGDLYIGTGSGIKKITGQIKVDPGNNSQHIDLSEYLKTKNADEKYATKDDLSQIQNGAPGKSAYEIAKENGFSGSEQEWLKSLRGANGITPDMSLYATKEELSHVQAGVGAPGKSAYEIAKEAGYVGSQEEWITSLKGADGTPGNNGESAYDIAVKKGYVGDEQTWLESLKGNDGLPGANGESAYQIAQRVNSFTGSEEEWLASLKGTNGNAGNSEHTVIFQGSDVNIAYPHQGKILSVTVIMSEVKATEIQLPLVKMDAASFTAGSNAWETIDDSIKMPAMTRYKIFENLTQNIEIKKGDILRIGSVEGDSGLSVTIKIKQEV